MSLIISYINYRFEIDEIEQRVNREREKYQAATQDKVNGLSAIPFISINDKVSEPGSLVGIMTRVWVGSPKYLILIPGRGKDLSLPVCPEQFYSPPSLLTIKCQELFTHG